MSSSQTPAPTDAPLQSSAAAPPPANLGRVVAILAAFALVVALVPAGVAAYWLISTATYDGDAEFAGLGYLFAALVGVPTIAALTLAGTALALRRSVAGVVLASISNVLSIVSLMLTWPWWPSF